MKLKYLPALDGIRACAFALVFVAHSGLEDAVPGGLGVTIFFFLSGYLITTLMRAEWASTGNISLSGFYKRRALRILPPLYLVMLIGWTLDWFHIPSHQASNFGLLSILFYFYNYASLLHPFPSFIPAGLNVVWSLMIEEHFYLIFPFVFLFAKKRAVSAQCFALILTGVCIAVLLWRCILVFYLHAPLTSPFSWTYGATDARFDSILWGCVMAIAFNPWCGDATGFLDSRRGLLAIVGAALLLLTLLWREPHFRESFRYTLQGIAMLPIFYFIVSAPGSWLVRALSWKPLRWLGWVSYTMYLCHLMVLSILHSYLKWNSWLVTVLALVVSGFFAELVRQCIEKPLQRLKRKKRLEVAVNN